MPKSRVQLAIEYIYAHPGCRSDAIATQLGVERKQVHSAVAPAVEAGLIVTCKVERPGKPPETEFKPSAAAPLHCPDFVEWKNSKSPVKPKPLRFGNKGPRANAGQLTTIEIAQPVSSPAAEREATPAEGGANNIGSRASVSPVGEDNASAEGAAVFETRAGSHGPEAKSSAAPVVSDEIPQPQYDPRQVAFKQPEANAEKHTLVASIGISGALMLETAEGNIYLHPAQARQLGAFMRKTQAVWGLYDY